jgi:two-component system, OmpR family, phosphate regulon sensor histidine kinase PhoR
LYSIKAIFLVIWQYQLKRRTLYIIILIVSVLGLFAVQYQYLNIGLNLAKVQFQKKVGLAAQEIKEDLINENQLTFLIGKAITLDDSYFTLSVDSVQDASRHFLNDFLTHRLTANGIDKDFSYRLFTKDSTDYLTAPLTYDKTEKVITYPVELEGYLPLLLNKNLILELQFKDLNNYFLFQLNGLTIPSLIFMIAIIFVIIWVLRSFYWQSSVITTTNDFINNLTHELKTPVFSIGLASKILQEKSSAEQKPLIELIQEQVNRLKIHIEKVLELSSLESKRKLLELHKMDFKPNLSKLCEQFQKLATLEDIHFEYHLKGEKYFLKAEPTHLENAVNNLLDNAKKYAEHPEIELTAEMKGNYLQIAIQDNGIGISPTEQELMFYKYYRISQGDTHKVKGYGLGLSYVKEIVKRHKGKIKVESELGKGTVIYLYLPLYGK